VTFNTLAVVRPGTGPARDQALVPWVSPSGEPLWEASDDDVIAYDIVGIGECYGSIGNQRTRMGLTGCMYVSAARVVVVASDYARGTSYRSAGLYGPVISSAIRTKLSERKAKQAAAGTFLVGQMRHPWVGRVVFAERKRRREEHSVRLCGTRVSAFGDRESVMLIAHFDGAFDTRAIATQVASRVIADRRDWTSTTDVERHALDTALSLGTRTPDAGKLPGFVLAGSYIIAAGSAREGSFSGRSRL
jgi:hypothetical protein